MFKKYAATVWVTAVPSVGADAACIRARDHVACCYCVRLRACKHLVVPPAGGVAVCAYRYVKKERAHVVPLLA
jgi:hypothetical protein